MKLEKDGCKMKISKRLQNLPDQFFSSLVEKVGKKVAEGHDVINLGQGNPDQPTPKHIVEAMKTASENHLTTNILCFEESTN